MNRDEAVALLRASGLADRIDRILPHLAPSVRARTTRDPSAGGVLVSRFGGTPVLPRGTPWPEWDSSALHRRWIAYSRRSAKQPGASKRFWDEQISQYEAMVRANPKPMPFLAMIDLADLGGDAEAVGLPSRGALLFFYDVERMQGSFWPEARGGWRILYVEDVADLAVVDAPPAEIDGLVSARLGFELEYVLPGDIREDTGDADLRVYENPEYERVYRALLGDSEIIHRLGGVPQEVQHGLFYQCQLASNGVDCGSPDDFDDARVQALAPGAKDWRLVLQIDTDESGPGWMWGDVGRLYYCLHEADLRARRFDRSWCVEQCS